MSADTWIAVAGVVMAGCSVALPLRYSIRKDKAERENANRESIRQAVKDATEPLIADRDFYRNRVSQLEDQLRRGLGSD